MTAPDLRGALPSAYSVERELTGGGMSRVFLARDEKLGRQIVIKILTPELSAALSVDRFQREIALAARLRHPNIVPLLDAGSSGAGLYYTMPYIAGESLRDRLKRGGPLPLHEAVRLTLEVADAIGYAHGENIVHRDIKPENILLDSGHAVVTDFGIARAVTQSETRALTMTGVAVGTPAYMSPEQFSATDDVDGRSDVYSLGCVLFEMLTGRTLISVGPFGTLTAGAATPAAVKDVLRKAMAESRDERFASAEEFSAALRTAAGSSAVWRGPAWRLGGMAAAIVLVASVGVWQLWPARVSITPVAGGQPLLTANYDNVTLRDLLLELGPLVGRTMMAAAAAETVRITARIDGKPWDVSLRAILHGKGLDAVEDQDGIIVINTMEAFATRSRYEADVTRAIIVCWRPAATIADMIRPRVGPGGSLAVDTVLNQIAVTTKASLMDDIVTFIRALDFGVGRNPAPVSPMPACRQSEGSKPKP